MAHYRIDAAKLRQAVAKRGFSSLADFAATQGINRATLHNYLKGRSPLSSAYTRLCARLQVDPLELLQARTVAGGPVADIDEILPIVRACVRHDPAVAVGLFGSRARGTARRYSDWDLGFTGGREGLSSARFLAIKRLVEELRDDLPRMVDVVNLDAAPAWFLLEVDDEPRFLGGCEGHWHYFLGVLHGAKKIA